VAALTRYEALLRQWSPRINLVAKSTLDHVWTRHFADSAQLVALAPAPVRIWLDFGSGAGFPGLVAAILLRERAEPCRFVLVESDARKCAFLRRVAQELGLDVDVRTTRAEALDPFAADVISARALAPLSQLLALAEPFCRTQTVCLFPKGRTVESELTEARRHWHIDAELLVSVTDPDARIVRIFEYNRRNEGQVGQHDL
jgi:16S rRNA (guanine527-N7)-methyltransferase